MIKNQLSAIGYASLEKPKEFEQWLMETGLQRKIGYKIDSSHPGWYNEHWNDYFSKNRTIFSGAEIKNIFEADYANNQWGQPATKNFFAMLSYLDSIEQKLSCYYYDNTACIVGYGKKRYVMPAEWFAFQPFKEYDTLTRPEFLVLGGPVAGGSLPETVNHLSKKNVLSELKRQEEAVERLREEQKNIEEGTTKELEPLKKQIEALQEQLKKQQDQLLAELHAKKEELERVQLELEQKIFILETQIYGIRCYLGEVVNFHQICNGKPADSTVPVIVHQKIRFLDEELGKAVSIYEFDGSDENVNTFLQILKYRSDIRQLFVPDERCITVLRVSRTGTVKGISDVVANSLQDYISYHGGQLAILVRNGEQLYIAWLDEDKIVLNDENAFYSPTRQKTERQIEDHDHTHTSSKEEIVSRYFLLSIIQGISDQGKLIRFPERVNVLSADPRYIIFSMADGWIADKRFGAFADILKRVSKIPMKEGDMVLTGTVITRDDIYDHGGRSRYESYNNDRGIGYKNRTHDACLKACEIMPVNKVLYDLNVDYSYEKIKGIAKKEQNQMDGHTRTTRYSEEDTGEIIGTGKEQRHYPFDVVEIHKKDWAASTPTKDELLRIADSGRMTYYCTDTHGNERPYYGYDHEELPEIYWKRYIDASIAGKVYHYFLAAKKECSTATANMEIEESEVIPLSYLCVTWVQYAITTGNIGDWRIGNSLLSYADSLRYLNIMHDFLKKRQESEQAMLQDAGLSSWLDHNPEWDVMLTEWRIKNHVRRLTPHSAKRFAKII